MSRLGQTTTVKQVLRDLAALVARIGVGGIFFANGWTKLEDGLITTGAKFLQQGAPAPGAWATVTMLTELIGGALLIAGLAVSTTGLILFAEALAVFLVAPPLNPISLNELVLLGAASLLLAVVGAGRVSVDHMVVIRRRESEAASEFAADTEADQVIASLRDPDKPKEPAPGKEPEVSATEDTKPHPRVPARGGEAKPAEDPAPVPGDTLVAGRKKPPPRGRRTPAAD
ncbi:DoxX family protein [Nonomuraea sp. NPDC050643]|uniref:DoxX family protein n=1 Tax=Nonomuraea sp. NPDC050643 TaxID=3155660 RepID=UPI0033C9C388